MDGSLIEASPQPVLNDEPPVSFDIQQIIATFRRRMKLVAAVALVVFVTVLYLSSKQVPQYTATASVMIDSRKKDVVDISAVVSGLTTDSTAIDTETQVLKSRSLAEKIVVEQRLDRYPEFNPWIRPKKTLTRFLPWVKPPPPHPVVKDKPKPTQAEIQSVVDTVLGKLSVSRSGLTYLIDVAFTSEDPALSAQMANAFANRYLLEQLDAKFDATQQANKWLESKVGDLRQQVVAAETEAQRYKTANNLMSAGATTLTEQEISTLDQQLATARADQAQAEARLSAAKDQLARGSNGDDVGEALASSVVGELRRQRSVTSQQVADLQGRYGDRHPDLLKAKRQLADVDAQIQSEIRRIISNLEAQVLVARERTASMVASASRAKGNLATSNQASVRLNELERNAEAAKTLYESFLTRFKETSVQQGFEAPDARVLSQAKIPGYASRPNKQMNLLIGIVLAVGAGLAAAVLAEALDNGLGTAEDIERRMNLTYLGSIPTLESTIKSTQLFKSKIPPVDFVVEKPLSSFSEAFRNLRAAVLFSRTGESVKVIAITSSLPGEGKTTTSLALARTMAIAGSSVVILDCDLRRRGISRFLSGEPVHGLIEVLNGTAVLEQALVRDGASGAMILPLARSAYTAKDVFRTPAMRRLLEGLRRRFDVVVLDTAPVLPVADTRILAAMADTVVVLTRWRKTPRKAVESTLRILRSTTANIAGAALTQVDLKAQAKSGYGDPGYYYQSYKKYYTE